MRRGAGWAAGLLSCLVAQALHGQVREISGRVTDGMSGQPVVSAQIAVVGTGTGTFSAEDGTFSLSVPNQDVTLRIEALGYRSVEVQVPADQASVTVTLAADVLGLEEIVVTGRATGVERRNLANAVATVDARELQRAPAATVERSIQGKIAGANIQSNSNAPGGGVQVELRGITSFLGGAPLYVVDGVLVSDIAITSNINAVTDAASGSNPNPEQDNQVNRIADLNPADIESVEILKGASASAIYGSKASNGVIIITTRRGEAGRPRFEFSQRFGVFDLAKTLTREFASAAEVDAAFGEGTAAQFNFDPGRSWEEDLAGRNPLSFESVARVFGGSEDTRYFVSALWKEDEWIIDRTGFDKQSLRVNLDQAFGDRVSLQVSSSLTRTVARRGISGNDNTGTSPWFAGAFTPRFTDLTRRPDGSFPANPWAQSNPIQTLALLDNDEEVWRFLASARLDVEAWRSPTQSLRVQGVTGVDWFSQVNDIFSPPELQFEPDDGLPGTSALSNSTNRNLNLNANLIHNYTSLDGRVSATTSTGLQFDTRELGISRVVTRNLLGGQSNIDQGSNVQISQRRERIEDLSVYLQSEVLLDERLLLTAGILGEQSSTNTRDDKLFFYPKAAASYRLPTPGSSFLDEIKLRAAYGESGKQPRFGQKFTPLQGRETIEGLLGFQIAGSTAGEIGPERQRELEGGFDATFAGSRARIEFTAYNRRVTDLLLTRGLAPSTGLAQEVFNGGSLRVNGIETALSLVPAQTRDFTWVFTTTFGLNRSEVTELPVPPFIPDPGQAGFVFGAGLGAFFIEEGESATQIIGNVPDGNGGSVLDKVGDSNPNFRWGFVNDFTVGDFSVYFLLDWQQGSQIINIHRLLFDLGSNTADCTNDADDPCAQRLATFSTDLESTYIEDATFLKLRELSLSWTLPENVTTGLWGAIRFARLTASARNLLTFTGYSGMDPEVSNFGRQAIGRNVDVASYPRSRSFWFGIDIGF